MVVTSLLFFYNDNGDKMKRIILEEVDSTNEYLKRNIDTLKNQTIVMAKHQTKGKGRNGHLWENPKDNNLMVSILYKDFNNIQDVWKMTIIASCSVVGLLDRYNIKAKIKWPNDIYVGDNKICGILVESVIEESLQGVIVGIGLNVNDSNYTSMKDITGKTYNLSDLLVGIQTFMNIYYNLYLTNQFDKILSYANDISYLKDKEIEYGNYGMVTFERLNNNGTVTIKTNNGRQDIIINEITLHKEN